MQRYYFVCIPFVLMVVSALLSDCPARGQIVPDTTLPNNSTVTPGGNTLTINGGTAAGGNLFHSFREFSVPTGGEAFFNNSAAIQNIFTRVTGKSLSNIDGTLRANGTANLFLLNPNGIIFGPNARLNIGGSFIGSTAEKINFADGSSFSATNTNATPLLTVSVPVGLQWGTNPGKIVNQSVAVDANGKSVGLSVQPGKTLALVGGDVSLEGGNIAVPAGRISLGAVGENSSVTLNATDNGWALGYAGASSFGDVELSQGALVEASGEPSSAVSVQARTLRILPGSRIYARNSGEQAGGDIEINASESVEAIGTGDLARTTLVVNETDFSNPLQLPTGLYSVTSGAGASGNVKISAPQLSIRDSAVIGSYTSAVGRGGDVTVNAPESVDVTASRLETYTVLDSPGASGNLTINTGRFSVKEVGVVSASTNGAGQGGNLTLNASESLELVGTDILVTERSDGVPLFAGTALFVATVGDGNAGELRLTTKRLSVRNGAFIAPNSGAGAGRPGNAIITASESVEFAGTTRDAFALPSGIQAAAGPFAVGTGGGNVSIATGKLIVRDGAVISMSNLSPGSGGSLEVTADSILLDNQASIVAETAFGEGGNIALRSRLLQLRNNSTISVTAGSVQNLSGLPPELAAFYAARTTGAGDGGNISINTDTLVALENSSIAANAQEGRGGRVSIAAQGVFLSSNSAITATSALGAAFAGVVNIQTPDFDSKSALLNLPAQPANTNQEIVSGCDAGSGSTFTVTGRGGLPEDPVVALSVPAIWRDNGDFLEIDTPRSQRDSIRRTSRAIAPGTQHASPSWRQSAGAGALATVAPPLQEATRWVVRSDGQVELIAEATVANAWYRLATCGDR